MNLPYGNMAEIIIMKGNTNVYIETDRLIIIPLTSKQLNLWINDIQTLEKELDCIYCAEPLTGTFLNIVKSQYDITTKDETNYLYHSFWFLVRKTDRIVVGSADFKDIPNEKGEIEIGYGLGKSYEHNGYMTEAVYGMCSWAMKQNGICCIIAETDIDGLASQHILKQVGFQKYERKEMETLWWRLEQNC